MRQRQHGDDEDCDQDQETQADPESHSFSGGFAWLLGTVYKMRPLALVFPSGILRISTQKACPSVTKNCVDLIPGSPLRLWPISIRTGPTGVL